MKSQILISKSVTLLEDENILIIYKKGNVVTCHLEPQLTAILLKLVHNKNTLVSKEDFIASVWETNVFVGQTALRKNIYKLRNLIKNNRLEDELTIVTIPKKGYKLLIAEDKGKMFAIGKKQWTTGLIYISIAAMLLLLFTHGYTVEEDIIIQAPQSEMQMSSN